MRITENRLGFLLLMRETEKERKRFKKQPKSYPVEHLAHLSTSLFQLNLTNECPF